MQSPDNADETTADNSSISECISPLAQLQNAHTNGNVQGYNSQCSVLSTRRASLFEQTGDKASKMAQQIQEILSESTENTYPPLRPIFSEMQTLFKTGNKLEWRETARWVKFEETVEGGGNRWSSPHVATLPLNALFELRQQLTNGAVLLNFEAGNSLENIIDHLFEHMIRLGQLTPGLHLKLRDILLRPHRHLHESHDKEQQVNGINCDKEHDNTEQEHKRVNKRFIRKVPPDAEANNVLVGEVDFLKSSLCAFVRLQEPTVLSDLTEVKVPSRFLFILLKPTDHTSSYQDVGRSIATLMSDEIFHEIAYRARTTAHILAGIEEFLTAVTVLPPGEWDPSIRIEPPACIPSQEARKYPAQQEIQPQLDARDEHLRMRQQSGLVFSGRLFGGLINDIKRKAPWYWSDFKDAFAMQSIASWIFLYFACLAPIITFGGLYGEATGKHIAAIESLVAGFVSGIVYGLFAGQPLSILASTGPVLVFETIVYEFCLNRGWDFLTFRSWIGTWIAVILLILTAIDASALVCYITRFTEENFAALIAIIFVYDAINSVFDIGKKYPVNNIVYECVCTPPMDSNATVLDYAKYDKAFCIANNGTLIGVDCDAPNPANVFLLSVILFLGTFMISIILKSFKSALFFPTAVRQFISDFAVIIAIVLMSLLDFSMNVDTEKLEVPHELVPTLPTRGWLIPPFAANNPTWSIFFAFIPALLGTILIFMDQQITAVIINRKENKLKKGCGYHLDLFVLSILIQICSTMGLPWFVAATVMSVNHVDSLKVESECSAPGEKPQFLGVRENRVTQVLIFSTIGASVLLTPILSHIPMPVLFGVFLYMGFASLRDLQLYDRVLILFMPAKYQPDYSYLRKVPINRVHLFTFIQFACLAILWAIKSFRQTSILFPLMLVVMVGIRKCLDWVFTHEELLILDDMMPEMGKTVSTTHSDAERGCCRRMLCCGSNKSKQEHQNKATKFLDSNQLSIANELELDAQSSLLKK